jgi:hypothetical protein
MIINLIVITLASLLLRKSKNPKFTYVKNTGIAMVVIQSIELVVMFFTFAGSLVLVLSYDSGYSHHKHFDFKRTDPDFVYEKTPEFEHKREMYHEMFQGIAIISSYLFEMICAMLFFGFVIWQIHSSALLIKCANIELKKSKTKNVDSSSSEDEKKKPKVEWIHKQKKKYDKSVQNHQMTIYQSQEDSFEKGQKSGNVYVEFQDVEKKATLNVEAQPEMDKLPIQYREHSDIPENINFKDSPISSDFQDF